MGTITEGITDLPKDFEYIIDIDPKEVFPNQTIKERALQNTQTASTQVCAIQGTLDDPDDECETNEHISKLFSQVTK